MLSRLSRVLLQHGHLALCAQSPGSQACILEQWQPSQGLARLYCGLPQAVHMRSGKQGRLVSHLAHVWFVLISWFQLPTLGWHRWLVWMPCLVAVLGLGAPFPLGS